MTPELHERYPFLSEQSSETFVRIADGCLRYASHASARMLGGRPESLVGRKLTDFIPTEQHELVTTAMNDSGGVTAVQFQVLPQDGGAAIWVEAFGRLMVDPDTNQPTEWVGALRDITLRRLAFERLERSEQRFRAMFNALPEAVVYTDSELRIIECNPAVRQLFGYQPEELAYRKLWVLFSSACEDSQLLLGELGEPVDRSEVILQRRGGQTFPGEATRRAVQDSPAHIGGLVWILSDLTHRKYTEAELAETNRRLAESREAERLRLARELHDGAVQELIGLGFSLAELQRKLDKSTGTAESMAAIGEAIKHQQAEVLRVTRLLRSLVTELRPAGLQEFGLVSSLEGLVAKLARHHQDGVSINLDIVEITQLTDSQQLCLFRAAQEALYNCLKHAKAKNITVAIRRVGNQALLTVEDDGVGFEVPPQLQDLTRADHYGLVGMAERVKLAKGLLSVQSRQGMGTEVCVTLTLEGEKN